MVLELVTPNAFRAKPQIKYRAYGIVTFISIASLICMIGFLMSIIYYTTWQEPVITSKIYDCGGHPGTCQMVFSTITGCYWAQSDSSHPDNQEGGNQGGNQNDINQGGNEGEDNNQGNENEGENHGNEGEDHGNEGEDHGNEGEDHGNEGERRRRSLEGDEGEGEGPVTAGPGETLVTLGNAESGYETFAFALPAEYETNKADPVANAQCMENTGCSFFIFKAAHQGNLVQAVGGEDVLAQTCFKKEDVWSAINLSWSFTSMLWVFVVGAGSVIIQYMGDHCVKKNWNDKLGAVVSPGYEIQLETVKRMQSQKVAPLKDGPLEADQSC